MIKIIEKNSDFVVIYKPPGVPSQPDTSGDIDAMTCTANQLSELCDSDDLFLVHRLDRVVGGIMVFARKKDAAAVLCDCFSSGVAVKEYFAIVEGVPKEKDGVFVDFIIKDPILNRAIVRKDNGRGAKRAELSYSVIDTKNINEKDISLIKVSLKTGRFHQIRAQFSSRGMALVGDGKYGSKDSKTRFPSLFAYRISFNFNGKTENFSILPNITEYPWSVFDFKNSEWL